MPKNQCNWNQTFFTGSPSPPRGNNGLHRRQAPVRRHEDVGGQFYLIISCDKVELTFFTLYLPTWMESPIPQGNGAFVGSESGSQKWKFTPSNAVRPGATWAMCVL